MLFPPTLLLKGTEMSRKVIHINGFNLFTRTFSDQRGVDTFELQIEVADDRMYLLVMDEGCTVTEAAFKLRQLAASIERHND